MDRRVLLVEDEPGLAITLTDRLRSEGYVVEGAADGERALRLGSSAPYDVIILDIMLPLKNGFDVCRDLRERGSTTPILMLTARGQLVDKVLGFKLGADDYLVKPFETPELLARLEALIRRNPRGDDLQVLYRFGNIQVDIRKAEVTRDGETITLSAREYQLLRYFVEHRETLIPREELLKKVWGYSTATLTRTVDVHVLWLRQKVEDNPRHPQFILTVHGLGYKFTG